MLFYSPLFLVFFLFLFMAYVCCPHPVQNRLLLASSLVFYGIWDWRFLGLLLGVCFLNYRAALEIAKNRSLKKRKLILWAAVASNLSVLIFFKYAYFLGGILETLIGFWKAPVKLLSIQIILPIGISFYTFQALSYTVDVYRKSIRPNTRFQDFLLYISFFPQLIAGPIERAGHLMTQITAPRSVNWERVSRGSFLFFWGVYEKVFVADNLAHWVDGIFRQSSWTGPQVLWSLYGFAIQIFCDFDGYSNMAKGLACCLGFDLMDNFRFPYFSKNPKEFWGNWHISLSSWLRDYLYLPLGGNTGSSWHGARNLMITMILGGLWHGASWNFVFWGIYHGVLLVIYRFLFCSSAVPAGVASEHGTSRRAVSVGLQRILFFHAICLGWLWFRVPSMGQAGSMLKALVMGWPSGGSGEFLSLGGHFLGISALFAVWHTLCYYRKDLMAVYQLHPNIKSILYLIMFYSICYGRPAIAQPFIYFQF